MKMASRSVIVAVGAPTIDGTVEKLKPFKDGDVAMEIIGMKIEHISSISGKMTPRPDAVIMLPRLVHTHVIRTNHVRVKFLKTMA